MKSQNNSNPKANTPRKSLLGHSPQPALLSAPDSGACGLRRWNSSRKQSSRNEHSFKSQERLNADEHVHYDNVNQQNVSSKDEKYANAPWGRRKFRSKQQFHDKPQQYDFADGGETQSTLPSTSSNRDSIQNVGAAQEERSITNKDIEHKPHKTSEKAPQSSKNGGDPGERSVAHQPITSPEVDWKSVPMFPPHIQREEALRKIKEKRLFKGLLRVNAQTFAISFVPIPGYTHDVLIESLEHRNRAFHGDQVVIELFPRDKWKKVQKDRQSCVRKTISSKEENLFGDRGDSSDDEIEAFDSFQAQKQVDESDYDYSAEEAEEDGEGAEEVAGEWADDPALQPTGRVVHILCKAGRELLGCVTDLQETGCLSNAGSKLLFRPCDSRLPRHVVLANSFPGPLIASEKAFSCLTQTLCVGELEGGGH